MDLLNLDQEEKRRRIVELKQEREKILNATRNDVLMQEISLLEAILILIRNRSSGEIKDTVNRTLKEIADLKMHDRTRKDVARWVQTLICELSQQ